VIDVLIVGETIVIDVIGIDEVTGMIVVVAAVIEAETDHHDEIDTETIARDVMTDLIETDTEMIATTAVAITMIDVTIDATIEVVMIDERIEVGIAATEKMDTSKSHVTEMKKCKLTVTPTLIPL